MSSKVAIVTDIHFGVNKNSEIFLNSSIKFFKEQFVPYLEKEKIKKILILGDVFDNRNNINVRISDEVYNLFINTLNKFDITILIGNHDIYYKTSNEIHSLKLLNHLNNVEVIDTICHKEIFGVNALFCPWIVNYNDPNIIKMFDESDAEILFGHFDIIGFYLNNSRISTEGLESEVFLKFKKVFSGHYHTPSSKFIGKTEIIYVGSPYQMTRNDMRDIKGFIVLDMATFKYKRIPNDVSLKFISIDYPEIPEREEIEGNIVDVNISIDKKDIVGNIIDKYIEKIEKCNPSEKVNVNLNVINTSNSDFEDMKHKITSIKDLIELYINNDNSIDNKDEVLNLTMEIYDEVR